MPISKERFMFNQIVYYFYFLLFIDNGEGHKITIMRKTKARHCINQRLFNDSYLNCVPC